MWAVKSLRLRYWSDSRELQAAGRVARLQHCAAKMKAELAQSAKV